jgi:hypothetical protein
MLLKNEKIHGSDLQYSTSTVAAKHKIVNQETCRHYKKKVWLEYGRFISHSNLFEHKRFLQSFWVTREKKKKKMGEPWKHNFELLVDDHGHCQVPSASALGVWVQHQRSRKDLSQAQIDKLNSINYPWAKRGESNSSWNKCFEMFKSGKECDELQEWRLRQRKIHHRNPVNGISPHRKKLLAQAGFDWKMSKQDDALNLEASPSKNVAVQPTSEHTVEETKRRKIDRSTMCSNDGKISIQDKAAARHAVKKEPLPDVVNLVDDNDDDSEEADGAAIKQEATQVPVLNAKEFLLSEYTALCAAIDESESQSVLQNCAAQLKEMFWATHQVNQKRKVSFGLDH